MQRKIGRKTALKILNARCKIIQINEIFLRHYTILFTNAKADKNKVPKIWELEKHSA